MAVTYFVLELAAKVPSIRVRKVVKNNRSPSIGARLFSREKAMTGG